MKRFSLTDIGIAVVSAAVLPGLVDAAPQRNRQDNPKDPQGSGLRLILGIHEIPEFRQDGRVFKCSWANPQCSADIKSTLEIIPDLENLPNRPPVTSIIDPLDTERRRQLNLALEGLNRSLDLSKEILAQLAAGSSDESKRLLELSALFGAERRKMMDAIVEFEKADPANVALDRDAILSLPEVRDAFPSPSDPNGDIGSFLKDKIEELNARAAARTRAAAAIGYQMRMGVFRVRRGVDPMPIHLPNYDTYNTLNPASLPRISTSISPTEAAENANEVKATMELAENAKSTISEIAARFRQRVDALRQTLQRQQAVLSSLPDNSKSVVDVARKLGENASKAGAAQQNEALTKLGASITAMAVSLENTTRAVNDLNGSISKTVIGFTKVTVGATSPDAVLRNILGLTTNTVGDVVGRAKDVQDQLTKIDESLKDIESAAGGLGPGQADGLALAQRVRKEIVGAITGTLDQLLQLPDSVDEAIRTVQSNAGDAAPLLDLKAPEILTVSDIVPTRLEIPRTDPSDGDVLDVAAQIFQGDKLVYEEHRSITVRFYGWHSGLSSGLVFVRSADHVGSNFKPEAAAVWRIRYTPRPGSRNPLGNLRPGVGIHATTLHFNSSVDDDATASNGANNIQFGVGLTFHLFGDVLQTGYGWNLGVQKDRSYTYLGIGIMKVLKQLLSERQ